VKLATDQTVGRAYGAFDTACAIPERDGARKPRIRRRVIIPTWAAYHVVAVRQGGHAPTADYVIFKVANQAIGVAHHAPDAAAATAKSYSASIRHRAVVPILADHYIVAVRQGDHAADPDLV